MDAPSMVQRSGDTLIVRSVVSGDQFYLDQQTGTVLKPSIATQMIEASYRAAAHQFEDRNLVDATGEELEAHIDPKDEGLPQCKIKRNYSCSTCTFFTQNPRYFLTHLRDVHGEKIVINECKLCLYASRHYQKLVRHMKMVHGSTDGIEEHASARKRQLGSRHGGVGRKRKQEEISVPAPLNPQTPSPGPHQQDIPMKPPTPIIKIEDAVDDDVPQQNRLLKCSVCDFTTLYRAQLVDHEQDEHYKTKFFRCEKCSYVTHIKARFSKHVKYHSMPMIKCVTCDFRTPYKWNLDRHMKNHGGSGPFKCAACNFTADIKQSLTVHEMNHHVPPVGHAAGMSMSRRRNKVGGTDISEDFLSENGDLSDSYNNNNNIEDFDEPMDKRCKYEDDDQPTDLSQKSNQSEAPKKTSRPVPNLIPIQAAVNNALNLTKSTSVKDFASLFSNDDSQQHQQRSHLPIPQMSPSSNCSSNSKKKNSNVFDRLKQIASGEIGRNENLICDCGYVSKCLSESIIHQKSCQKSDDQDDKHSSCSPINLTNSSTRCQYCRHRCKSSGDLSIHMQNCYEAASHHKYFDSMSDLSERHDSGQDDVLDDHASEGTSDDRHPMENKVFVWNRIPGNGAQSDERASEIDDEDKANSSTGGVGETKSKGNSEGYYGVETAPGYGEVTKKMSLEEDVPNSPLKKVYKCPHCSFWASTASRFHVHIVGHLNKKPFECSLCAYRSNWRWDITKHIRLKTIRDPGHKNARVLMNDETGRRNYTKYNKYITLMKVTEEDGDPKLMKSGEMTPNQEASLAFFNDVSASKSNSNAKPKEEVGPKSSSALDAGSTATMIQNLQGIDPAKFLQLSPFFANAMLGVVQQHQQQAEAEQHNLKRSPPPLMRPSQQDDLMTQDIKIDEVEKRTSYKCRKCNYRNANREMVLAHVKGHYEEAGINLSKNSSSVNNSTTLLCVSDQQQPAALNSANIYMNNMLAAATALCLQQQQQTLSDVATTPSSSSGNIQFNNQQAIPMLQLRRGGPSSGVPHLSPTASLSCGTASFLPSHPTQPFSLSLATTTTGPSKSGVPFGSPRPTSRPSSSTGLVITPIMTSTRKSNAPHAGLSCSIGGGGGSSGVVEHYGETDEASSQGVVTTSGGSGGCSTTGWRGPAPYRCGHCHQVSNWKHVIQRHCRLKHSGDIRIETIDRASDRSVSVYIPLSAHSGIQNSIPSTSSNLTINTSSFGTNQQQQQKVSSNRNQLDKLKPPTVSPESQIFNPQNILQQQLSLGGGHIQQTFVGPSAKSKQLQCPSCPFISESKSQMTYHSSLHKCKPDMYTCDFCNYICSKKQQLNQHIKARHEKIIEITDTDADAIDLRSPPLTPVEQQDNSSAEEFIPSNLCFCSLCPARFFGRKDLLLHSKGHTNNFQYRCKYCTYSARQEPSLLTHSAVHSVSYNDKIPELAEKFKADAAHPCPKVIQLNLTDEKIYVVDRSTNEVMLTQSAQFTDLQDAIEKSVIQAENQKLHEDETSEHFSVDLSETNNDSLKNGISLLKQQLEAGERAPDRNSTTPTSSLLEKCSKCPFETHNAGLLKTHLKNHKSISEQNNSFDCDHCDYSVAGKDELKEHTKIHFSSSKNSKNVAFYTRYDNLELMCATDSNEHNQELVYSSVKDADRNDEPDENDSTTSEKIIVDLITGECLEKVTGNDAGSTKQVMTEK